MLASKRLGCRETWGIALAAAVALGPMAPRANGQTPGTVPAAPTGLTATPGPSGTVNLTWTDNSNNETAFAVWRTGGGSAFARVAALAANSTSYTDWGLTPNTTYTYEVRAINNVGASAWSNQVMVTTPP